MFLLRRYIIKFSYLLIFAINPIHAAFDHFPSSPQSIGMGHLVLTSNVHPTDGLRFPSALARMKSLEGSILWGNRYGIKDLGHQSASVNIFAFDMGLNFGYSQFGNSLYRESITYLAAGKSIKERINLGISIAGYNLSIKDYGSATALGITTSWQIQLNDFLNWSGSLQNLNAPTIGDSSDPLPQIIHTGMSLVPYTNVTTVFGWEQDTEYSGRFKFGTAYQVFPWMDISAGFVSNPGQGTGGISIHINNFGIYYGTSTHPELGLSHWFGMGYVAE